MSARAAALALLLAPAAAAAADPAPAQVLERAGRGRAEFLRAVGDVERFAPRLPRKEQFYPYVELLDALQAVGRRYDLETLGVDPVKDLGAELTSDGAKWLRLDVDTPAFVAAFLKWSTNDTRATVAGDSALLLTGAETPERLLAWNRGALAALVQLRALRADRAAIEAFEELQGVVVRTLLARRKELTPEQISRAVGQTRSVPGVEELLAFLDQETAAGGDAADRRRTLDWALAVAESARGLGPAAPLRLRASAGAVVLEELERSLFQGDVPDAARVDAVLEALMPSQRAELASQLVDLYAERVLPPEQAEYLWTLSDRLQARFVAAGRPERGREFRRLGLRLAAAHFARDKVLEGVYRIKVGGEEQALVIAELGGGTYALDFHPVSGDKPDLALWNAAFDYRDGEFRADRADLDAADLSRGFASSRWPRLSLDAKKNQTARGALVDASGFRAFEGERVATFPTFAGTAQATLPLDDAAGLYKGKAGDQDATLLVTSLGTQLAASFSFASSSAPIALDYGYYDRARGAAYFTSAESRGDASWSQVRGAFSGDGKTFTGAYLVGAGGAVAPLKLRKEKP